MCWTWLAEAGRRTRESIAVKAAQEGNSNAVIMANAALYEVMKARLGANLLLVTPREEQPRCRPKRPSRASVKALAQLEKVTGGSAYKAEVAEAKTLGAHYEEAFKESEKLDERSTKSSRPRSSRPAKSHRRGREDHGEVAHARNDRRRRPCPPPSPAPRS